MIFSFACLCSSFTHAFALSSEDCGCVSVDSRKKKGLLYSLCNIIDDNSAVGISVVHGGQRLVSFLSCSIPYLKLHCRGIVKGDGLREEGGADC